MGEPASKLMKNERNRRNQGCQTDFEQPTENNLIEEAKMEARESAKIEFNKILEEERKEHQIEVKKLKKKQWCYLCLKEARYYCCTTYFYCTVECQRTHWSNGGHKDVCKKRVKKGDTEDETEETKDE